MVAVAPLFGGYVDRESPLRIGRACVGGPADPCTADRRAIAVDNAPAQQPQGVHLQDNLPRQVSGPRIVGIHPPELLVVRVAIAGVPGRESYDIEGDHPKSSVLVGSRRFLPPHSSTRPVPHAPIPVGPRVAAPRLLERNLGPGNRLAGVGVDDLPRLDRSSPQPDWRRLGRRAALEPVGERSEAVAIALVQVVDFDPHAKPAKGRQRLGDAKHAVHCLTHGD